eukprot:gb/GECG01009900.1/.p1 GENE.gb/GECG01009900.1/~~gb/GECG01009900.1/.p1  ORF type:complete len:534 (+),score=84.54 gb/GECG01009900.1/:1-1602(+)
MLVEEGPGRGPYRERMGSQVPRQAPLYGMARRVRGTNPMRKGPGIRPAFGRHHKTAGGSVGGPVSYKDPLFTDLQAGGDVKYESAARNNPMRIGRKDKKEDRARMVEERRLLRREQRRADRLNTAATHSDHDAQSATENEQRPIREKKSSSKPKKKKKKSQDGKNKSGKSSSSEQSSNNSSESDDSDSSVDNETARVAAYCTCGLLSTPELRTELRQAGSELLPSRIGNGSPLSWYHTVYTDVLHSKGWPHKNRDFGPPSTEQMQVTPHTLGQTSKQESRYLENEVNSRKSQMVEPPNGEDDDNDDNFEQRFHKKGIIPEFEDEAAEDQENLPWRRLSAKDAEFLHSEASGKCTNSGIELSRGQLQDSSLAASPGKTVNFMEPHKDDGSATEEERLACPDVFYFTFGVIVFWGFTEAQEREFLERIRKFQYQLVKTIEYDDMAFTYGKKSTVSNDEVTLKSDDALEKLAVSYAFAQSVKLSVCEQRVNDTIEETKDIPVELARSGKIGLSASDISRKIGELFIEVCSYYMTLG